MENTDSKKPVLGDFQIPGIPGFIKNGFKGTGSILDTAAKRFPKVELKPPQIPIQVTQAGGRFRDGFKEIINNMHPPKAFTQTSDDCNDVFYKSFKEDGLCSKCRSLPIQACYDESFKETDEVEIHWATSLSRIIYHSDWCRMCRLLFSMLTRPEFDPLKHPEVAKYVQEELQGMTMLDWVEQGWEFTDANWPFGRSEYRYNGATYVLGPAKDLFPRSSEDQR